MALEKVKERGFVLTKTCLSASSQQGRGKFLSAADGVEKFRTKP